MKRKKKGGRKPKKETRRKSTVEKIEIKLSKNKTFQEEKMPLNQKGSNFL